MDFHECDILLPELWVCTNCGETFPRKEDVDSETCIIEGDCQPESLLDEEDLIYV